MAAATPPDLHKLRNIGIIAHIDAGKTTTTEHLLFYAGEKHRLGTVDEGTTETDYDAEEQERGITIYSACVPLHWRGHTINLIDTPGHVDFTAEVERSLRVLDGAVVVFDAQKGVEAQSETVWRQADRYQVPRLVFINKMDVVGADFEAAVDDVRKTLHANPLPLFIPIGQGSPKETDRPFRGIIDLIERKALFFEPADYGKTVREEPVPEEMVPAVERAREELFDVLTRDESPQAQQLAAAYLEGREVEPQAIREVVRDQTLRRLIQPVFCGSGREHIGIQPLMDGVCWYLPSPPECPPVVGVHPGKPDKTEKRRPDVKEPFCGLVFKVISGAHGEMFYIRIYSGKLKANSRYMLAGRDKKELIGKLFHIHADPERGREELEEAYAGDIVATLGLKDAVTGDTLCETQHPILLEPIVFVQPVVTQSVEPESSADKDKLLDVLARLQREDPTFVVRHDPETGQTVMSGMGTLHLEVKRNRMERDFRLRVRVGKPRVSYRETLASPVTTTGEFVRHTGAPMFARVTVRFDNEKSDVPVTVSSRVKPGTLTPEFLAAAERGLKGALQTGEVGYPLLNVQATVIDGQMDPETSTEPAFEAAAADAVRKALKGNVVLLEPIMKVSVTVPEEFVGGVIGDLTTRRGEIHKLEARGNVREIEAAVPLARLFDYVEAVRSLSQGRAGATIEPSHYAPAPPEVLRAMLGEGEGY